MSYEKGIVMKKKLRREAGGAAAEFAIILPLLIFFIFGIVEFGFLLYNKQVLTNASREGARAGIVVQVPKPTDQDIRDIIANYCNGHLVMIL
jgi:Flp pilus assembly protein TadG